MQRWLSEAEAAPPGASGRASDPEELVFMRADNMSQAIGGQMADAVER